MAEAAVPPPTLDGLRAFVVEDETLVAIFLEDMLEELGCAVVGCAGQVARALALIEALQVDIAIIDINLAGEASYPIAEIMKQRGIPFIFATGYGDGALRPDWQDRPVLHKPYQKSDLQQALALALARSMDT